MINEKFVEGIDILLNSGLKYQTKPNKKLLNIWYEFLQNIDNDSWNKVIQHWITRETDFPTIAGLLKVYNEITVAIVDIRGAIDKSQFGRAYIDPILEKAIRKNGGFSRIGKLDNRDYEFTLKDIERDYKEISKREQLKMIKYNQNKIGE